MVFIFYAVLFFLFRNVESELFSEISLMMMMMMMKTVSPGIIIMNYFITMITVIFRPTMHKAAGVKI